MREGVGFVGLIFFDSQRCGLFFDLFNVFFLSSFYTSILVSRRLAATPGGAGF